MSATILVGLQWGDEGKGKVIDALTDSYKHVVRSQGGHNAGHTVVVGSDQYSFHLIPSAILHPKVNCYIAAGVVIDPLHLWKEIQKIGVDLLERLLISPYCHVILPRHIALDKKLEAERGTQKLGTTGRGIGPCYTDKAARHGLRLIELYDEAVAKHYFESLEEYKSYLEAAQHFKQCVAPVEELLFEALERKENLLLEGAQGTLLDVQFGTYPFVTSSQTTAAGICAGAGIGPSKVKKVLGVLKAYQTRVGSGPFPTELSEEEKQLFPDNHTMREVGTTTGRHRRIGWLDLVLASQACMINGVDEIAITKLDILSSMEEIPVCIGYEPIQDHEMILSSRTEFQRVKPIYRTLPGWNQDVSGIKNYSSLPQNLRSYLQFIEDNLKASIKYISVGPARDQFIIRQ